MNWLSVNFRRGPALEAYCAPAQARRQVWRLLLGLGLLLGVQLLAGAGLGAAIMRLDDGWALLNQLASGASPRAMLAILMSFLGLWLGLFLVVRLLHRRTLTTLAGGGLRGRQIARGFAVALAIWVVTLPLTLVLTGTPMRAPIGLGEWLRLAPAATVLVFLQVGAEEFMFRGYLLQQLAARWRSPMIWAAAPSILFGMLHYSPVTYGAAAPVVVVATAMLGWGLAVITARTGNISTALGVHFGVNLPTLLLVGSPDHLGGLALFHVVAPSEVGPAAVVADAVIIVGALAAAAWVWRPRGG